MEKYNTSQKHLNFQNNPREHSITRPKTQPALLNSSIPSSLQELIKKYSSKYSTNSDISLNIEKRNQHLKAISKVFQKHFKSIFCIWKHSKNIRQMGKKFISLSSKPSSISKPGSNFSQPLLRPFFTSKIPAKVPENLKTIQKIESSLKIFRFLKKVAKKSNLFSFCSLKAHLFQLPFPFQTKTNTEKHLNLDFSTSSGFSIAPNRKKPVILSVTQEPSLSLISSRLSPSLYTDFSPVKLAQVDRSLDLNNHSQASKASLTLSNSNLVQSDDSLVELEEKNEELSPNFTSLTCRNEIVLDNALKSTSTSSIPQRFQFDRYNVRESQDTITEMSLSSLNSVESGKGKKRKMKFIALKS